MIYDIRYPFTSLIEFIDNSYFFKYPTAHLTFGLICILISICFLVKRKTSLYFACCILFFCFAPYTNYCYQINGIIFSDYCGTLACITYLFKRKKQNNIFFKTLVLVLFVIVSQFLVLYTFEFQLMRKICFLDRIMSTGRLLVLFFNCGIFFNEINKKSNLLVFRKTLFVSSWGFIFSYLIQVGLFVYGVESFGSFSPAGWSISPIPCFGGISIERGHFGKMTVPFYPILLYFAIVNKRYPLLICFTLVTFLNLSASSYSYFIFYMMITCILFYKQVKRLIPFYFLLITIFSIAFNEQLRTLFSKIYELAYLGDETGGRSFSEFIRLASRYPLGWGFSTSTSRNYHLSDIDLNNSILIFFNSLSFFSIPFLLIIINLYKNIAKNILSQFQKNLFRISFFGAFFIWMCDPLYVSPPVWLPIVFFTSLHDIKAYERI